MDNTNHHQDESKPRDLPPLEILPEHHKFEKMKSPETSTQVSDSNASSPNNNEDSLNKQQISPNLKTHKQTTRHTIRQTKKCIYYDIIKEWEKRNQSKIQSQSLASTLKNLNKTSDLAHICRTITYKDWFFHAGIRKPMKETSSAKHYTIAGPELCDSFVDKIARSSIWKNIKKDQKYLKNCSCCQCGCSRCWCCCWCGCCQETKQYRFIIV